MIPTTNPILDTNITTETMPSKNYKMHYLKEEVKGYRDELSAMEQVIYKILNTQRYKYLIYSWNYGIEIDDLIGKDVRLVCVELKGRITEELLQDDRITAVDSFSFDTSKRHVVYVSFVVHTIFGDIETGKEVEY